MEKCRTCGDRYHEGGDGFDGECPNCADRTDKKLRASRSLANPLVRAAARECLQARQVLTVAHLKLEKALTLEGDAFEDEVRDIVEQFCAGLPDAEITEETIDRLLLEAMA